MPADPVRPAHARLAAAIVALAVALWLAMAAGAVAQPAGEPDYAAWEQAAGRTEQLLDSEDTTPAALDAEPVKCA